MTLKLGRQEVPVFSDTFVPLCTCWSDQEQGSALSSESKEILLCKAYACSTIVFWSILEVENEKVDVHRGIYMTKEPVHYFEKGNFQVFGCALRGVDLQHEPIWSSIMLLISSRLFFVSKKSLQNTCLQDLSSWMYDFGNILELESKKGGLQVIAPCFTWVSLDDQVDSRWVTEKRDFDFEMARLCKPKDRQSDIAAELFRQIFVTRHFVQLERDLLMADQDVSCLLSLKEVAAYKSCSESKSSLGVSLTGAWLSQFIQCLSQILSTGEQDACPSKWPEIPVLERLVADTCSQYYTILVHRISEDFISDLEESILPLDLRKWEKVDFWNVAKHPSQNCSSYDLQHRHLPISTFEMQSTFRSLSARACYRLRTGVEKLFSAATLEVPILSAKKSLVHNIKQSQLAYMHKNSIASQALCKDVLDRLHAVALENEYEVGTMMGSALIDSHGCLSRTPATLLLYKHQIDQVLSIYQNIAGGPEKSNILVNFLHTTVCNRLSVLADKEFAGFTQAKAMQSELIEENDRSCEYRLAEDRALRDIFSEAMARHAMRLEDMRCHHSIQYTRWCQELKNLREQITREKLSHEQLYQETMRANSKTMDIANKLQEDNRIFKGYLFRYHDKAMFTRKWRQFFYVVDRAYLFCYRSKSEYEERCAPLEAPLCLSDCTITVSERDHSKIKVIRMHSELKLRLKAPANIGRKVWIERLTAATQIHSLNKVV